MKAIEIARRFAALGSAQEACSAYALAVHENNGEDPALDMEASLYILQFSGPYQVAYTCLLRLYEQGYCREDCLAILERAFYEPNVKELRARYEKNCRLLKKYPYLFRKDFLPFEQLPLRFFPYDEQGYLPFHPAEGRFDAYVNFNFPVVSRNFFRDLENPILARDVYSQYELEYLKDNVRESEWIGRENHIYLHYTDWGRFCACLQCIELRPLLKSKKFVFLIGEEDGLYPIDFRERFGIDYSVYPVRPVGIREVNRLIWHTQLSTHNGGDFFNEIFDAHPNLIAASSLMFDSIEETIAEVQRMLKAARSVTQAVKIFGKWPPRLISELYLLKGRTEKDVLVGMFLRDTLNSEKTNGAWPDASSRIVPALFFQPHFSNIMYSIYTAPKHNRTTLHSKQYDKIINSPIFRSFPYIKTFTPIRRMTASYGATVRFMYLWESERGGQMGDVVSQRVMNRSYMVDPQLRLFTDSILVRFEDAKLNPKATFSALAAFLDLPVTASMGQCTEFGRPLDYGGYLNGGFDTAAVYKTYDEYADDRERYYIEYFLRDAYEEYGYDFHYYDGAPVDLDRVRELVDGFSVLRGYTRELWMKNKRLDAEREASLSGEEREKALEELLEAEEKKTRDRQIHNAQLLLRGLYFVNVNGQPLRRMPLLRLDPALLEQPLYH